MNQMNLYTGLRAIEFRRARAVYWLRLDEDIGGQAMIASAPTLIEAEAVLRQKIELYGGNPDATLIFTLVSNNKFWSTPDHKHSQARDWPV